MSKFTDYLDSLQNKDPEKSAKNFWMFYGVFFLLVFLMLAFGRTNYANSEYEYDLDEEEIEMKLSKNYLFDYKVFLDNQIFDYYGKKDQNTELFKYNNYDYYYNEKFYIKKDAWEEVENPYKFYEFLNYDNYSKIIGSSFFDSKNESEKTKELFYKISSNTLNELLYDKNSDFEEIPNDILVVLNKDNMINSITFNLNSFCLNNNLCQKSLKIELTFDMVDEIKEIDNPIE